ncbi:hypothetical protein [Streptomyces sp. NPDC095613]|uniref:hypothetical protein n=1 Tax=Streptomyces sp. NPDC095613 TaxID=3155540 RepID=UPI003329D6BC
MRQEFPDHIRTYLRGEHFWPPPYPAAAGSAPLAVIKEYIENQKRPDRGQQRRPVHPLGPEQCQEALPPGREPSGAPRQITLNGGADVDLDVAGLLNGEGHGAGHRRRGDAHGVHVFARPFADTRVRAAGD